MMNDEEKFWQSLRMPHNISKTCRTCKYLTTDDLNKTVCIHPSEMAISRNRRSLECMDDAGGGKPRGPWANWEWNGKTYHGN